MRSTVTGVCAQYRRLLLRFSPHPHRWTRTGAILRASHSPIPRIWFPLLIRAREASRRATPIIITVCHDGCRRTSNVCTSLAPSALIPRMRLLIGRSTVMSGVPWELGCAPCELHQKEMDILGGPPHRSRNSRGSPNARVRDAGMEAACDEEASSSRVRSNRSTSALITRPGRMRRRA